MRAGARARRPPRQRDQARQRARRAAAARRAPEEIARGSARPASSGRSASTDASRSCSTSAARRRPPASGGYVDAAAQPPRRAPARRRARDATSPSARSTCARSRPATPSAARAITIEPAIEVGNIFKLGTRYSEPLGAHYLDEQGREQPIWMGCYGIGTARIAAAAVEQFADEHGISWPRAIAPVRGAPRRGRQGRQPERASSPRGSTRRCATAGVEVLYDDRDAGPGEKFADAELLGCPLRLTVGRARSSPARSRSRSAAAAERRRACRSRASRSS